MEKENSLSIAVIGGGIAGIIAAYLLQKKHDVVLYEKNDHIGGHANTFRIAEGPTVDTAFVLLNDQNYPLLNRFLKEFRVEIKPADMSFSYYDSEKGIQYSSSGLNSIFAQRRNIFRPSFYGLIREVFRFHGLLRKDLVSGFSEAETLGAYFKKRKLSRQLLDLYVIPVIGSFWPLSFKDMMDCPMSVFVHYYNNYNFLNSDNRPEWYFVKGGSSTYVQSFLYHFSGETYTAFPVDHITRHATHVEVFPENAPGRIFDRVVIACHADEAFSLLSDPGDSEQRVLSAWSYPKKRILLHTDKSLMPPLRRAWASRNCLKEKTDLSGESSLSITYYLNRLQGLNTDQDYFLTINPCTGISGKHIFAEIEYTHPLYTFDSIKTRDELPYLQGRNHTYYCGSYHGYGTHEDAVRSAVYVAKLLGVEW